MIRDIGLAKFRHLKSRNIWKKDIFNLGRATTTKVVVFQLGLCSEKLCSFERASERASSSI